MASCCCRSMDVSDAADASKYPSGCEDLMPVLHINFSRQHAYGHVVDAELGQTIASASTCEKGLERKGFFDAADALMVVASESLPLG